MERQPHRISSLSVSALLAAAFLLAGCGDGLKVLVDALFPPVDLATERAAALETTARSLAALDTPNVAAGLDLAEISKLLQETQALAPLGVGKLVLTSQDQTLGLDLAFAAKFPLADLGDGAADDTNLLARLKPDIAGTLKLHATLSAEAIPDNRLHLRVGPVFDSLTIDRLVLAERYDASAAAALIGRLLQRYANNVVGELARRELLDVNFDTTIRETLDPNRSIAVGKETATARLTVSGKPVTIAYRAQGVVPVLLWDRAIVLVHLDDVGGGKAAVVLATRAADKAREDEAFAAIRKEAATSLAEPVGFWTTKEGASAVQEVDAMLARLGRTAALPAPAGIGDPLIEDRILREEERVRNAFAWATHNYAVARIMSEADPSDEVRRRANRADMVWQGELMVYRQAWMDAAAVRAARAERAEDAAIAASLQPPAARAPRTVADAADAVDRATAADLADSFGLAAPPQGAAWAALRSDLLADLVNTFARQSDLCLSADADVPHIDMSSTIKLYDRLPNCDSDRDCRPRRDCTIRASHDTRNCHHWWGNDPWCEAQKAAQNAIYDADAAARKLDCERLKSQEKGQCEAEKEGERQMCEVAKAALQVAGKNLARLDVGYSASGSARACLRDFTLADDLGKLTFAIDVEAGQAAGDLSLKYTPLDLVGHLVCVADWTEHQHFAATIADTRLPFEVVPVVDTSTSALSLAAHFGGSRLKARLRPGPSQFLMSLNMALSCPFAAHVQPLLIPVSQAIPELRGDIDLPLSPADIVMPVAVPRLNVGGATITPGVELTGKALVLSAQVSVPAPAP